MCSQLIEPFKDLPSPASPGAAPHRCLSSRHGGPPRPEWRRLPALVKSQHASGTIAAPRRSLRPSVCPASPQQHADPVTPPAVTWRHKLHVNQRRVCPEVARDAISANDPAASFVNAICLIAPYQYTDETRWRSPRGRGECFGRLYL